MTGGQSDPRLTAAYGKIYIESDHMPAWAADDPREYWEAADAYERANGRIDAAQTRGPQTHAIVLLGGDAGLRCGEIIGLEWGDVDFAKRQLCVQRSEWRRHVTAPKGGRLRYVPMTRRLGAVLHGVRHTRGARVLCHRDGKALTQNVVGKSVRRAARLAEVPVSGVHRLRHTFCSHLAMRGAPGRAIQALAGHQDLVTTQRYMHLSPAALETAIGLLERPTPAMIGGNALQLVEK